MAGNQKEMSLDTKRILDIVKVISKYKVAQGLTPEKLCAILKELGPTFVKLGQLLSMHPEILSPEYCKALEDLRTDAQQLVAVQIREIISAEYGKPYSSVFRKIVPVPIGKASIAQVHEAELLDGTRVAVKIQRPDIYATMERDVRLMKMALSIVKPKSINGVMSLEDTLDEVWIAAQEEMDFIREAENIRKVRSNIEGIEYVYCPAVYDELSTKNVLVMEYIGGFEINDRVAIADEGYDTDEICTKFINNYIKQFSEDRFFHADPHPGNVRVEDGRIVWLDLGMMGRFTEIDAKLINSCMQAIFRNDYRLFADSVLSLCEHDPAIDMAAYYERMRAYLDKYRVISMGQMSSSLDIFADLYRIARDFAIKVPRSLTMFWRSLSIMEGTVSELSPDTDLTAIIGKHIAAQAVGGKLTAGIAKSISHRRLISGKRLSYNGHVQEPDEDEEEDIEE